MKIRNEYASFGTAEKFYEAKGAEYRNPAEHDIRRSLKRHMRDSDMAQCLDLAAGSGEITLWVRENGGSVEACDPYCQEAFKMRTKTECHSWSFEDIAHGIVEPPEELFSSVICSFALHLLNESYLPALLAMLTSWTRTLIVLTPHKRPHLNPNTGWILISEFCEDRVRFRRYVYGA